MLRQGDTGRLGEEARHGDAFWLEPLIQSVQGICVDAVCYSELRNLQRPISVKCEFRTDEREHTAHNSRLLPLRGKAHLYRLRIDVSWC